MKLAAGYAPEPAQQVGLHPDFFCSANDLPALGVSDFESPFAYGTDDGFFTPNEKYLIHRCRMFHNVILLSLILGTTLRNINLAGESSYCGVFYFTSIPVSRIGFILTGILADYLRQNKRSKVLAPGQCQGAAWRQIGLAETPHEWSKAWTAFKQKPLPGTVSAGKIRSRGTKCSREQIRRRQEILWPWPVICQASGYQ